MATTYTFVHVTETTDGIDTTSHDSSLTELRNILYWTTSSRLVAEYEGKQLVYTFALPLPRSVRVVGDHFDTRIAYLDRLWCAEGYTPSIDLVAVAEQIEARYFNTTATTYEYEWYEIDATYGLYGLLDHQGTVHTRKSTLNMLAYIAHRQERYCRLIARRGAKALFYQYQNGRVGTPMFTIAGDGFKTQIYYDANNLSWNAEGCTSGYFIDRVAAQIEARYFGDTPEPPASSPSIYTMTAVGGGRAHRQPVGSLQSVWELRVIPDNYRIVETPPLPPFAWSAEGEYNYLTIERDGKRMLILRIAPIVYRVVTDDDQEMLVRQDTLGWWGTESPWGRIQSNDLLWAIREIEDDYFGK